MSHETQHAPRRLRSVLVVALGLVTMAGLTACGGDGDGGQSSGDTTSMTGGQGLPSAGGGQGGPMMEMQQLQKQLQSISQEAMQDTALQQQMQEVQTLIDETMRAMSPQAGEQLDRMDSIRGQLQTAQSQGDTARLRTLVMEAQKLQQSLQKLRTKAMQQQEVAQELKSFQEDLRAEMRRINPNTDSLMDRADSLRQEMQGQAQGMMGGPPGDTSGN